MIRRRRGDAPLRGELAVELATEAGVDAVLPWRAARSVARWDEGARGAKALARWQGAARAAAKQARRSRVPKVREPVDTKGLAEAVSASAGAVVLEAGATQRLARCALPERRTGSVEIPRASSSSSSSTNTPGSTTQPAPRTQTLPQRIPEGMCLNLYVSPSAMIVWPAFGPPW